MQNFLNLDKAKLSPLVTNFPDLTKQKAAYLDSVNPGWLRSHNGNLSHFVKLSLAFVAAGLRQIFAPGWIESKTTKLFKFLHLKIFFALKKVSSR